jgi:hypothetical protein
LPRKQKIGFSIHYRVKFKQNEDIMSEFYQGIIAAVGILGGLCAFNYWVFSLMEKRIEDKIDSVGTDINKLQMNCVKKDAVKIIYINLL